MPTDRAQDTEAIRAARERLRRACEEAEALYRVRVQGEPTIRDDNRINGILTLDLPDALGAYDRLVARLEAAEQALRELYEADASTDIVRHGAARNKVRAALAAAAPGETGQTP